MVNSMVGDRGPSKSKSSLGGTTGVGLTRRSIEAIVILTWWGSSDYQVRDSVQGRTGSGEPDFIDIEVEK